MKLNIILLLLFISNVLCYYKFTYRNDVFSSTGDVAFAPLTNCTPTGGFLPYHDTQSFRCDNTNNSFLFLSGLQQFPYFEAFICQTKNNIYRYNISNCF